jgi:hypothetical protein
VTGDSVVITGKVVITEEPLALGIITCFRKC